MKDVKFSQGDPKRFLRPDIACQTTQTTFVLRERPAIELVTSQRFDIVMKMSFLYRYSKFPDFATSLYRQDVKAQTRGTFIEPYDPGKRSFGDFLERFRALELAARAGELNTEQFPISLDCAGVPLDGAHRTAAAAVHNLNVWTVETDAPANPVTSGALERLGVTRSNIERAAIDFGEISSTTCIVVLWPIAAPHHSWMAQEFGDLIHHQDLYLDRNGFANLVEDLYCNEVDPAHRRGLFPGIAQKVVECFIEGVPTRVALVNVARSANVREIKERVRTEFGGTHSFLHTTDTSQEAVHLSKLLFSSAGRHFLKHAIRRPAFVNPVLHRIDASIAPERKPECIIDGGSLLAIYGLRKTYDLDFISCASTAGSRSDDDMEHYSTSCSNLFIDPMKSFLWRGVRFLALEEVAYFKSQRSETKDRADVQLIESLSETDRRIRGSCKLRSHVYWYHVRIYRLLREALRSTPIDALLLRIRARKVRSNHR